MILGITGGVGAGKSSVLAILEKEYNAKLILADEVGRELMQPGEANYVNIVNAFGKEILNEDQTIDTKKLAATAFSNIMLFSIHFTFNLSSFIILDTL